MKKLSQMTYTTALLTVDDDYARKRAASDQLSGRNIPQNTTWMNCRLNRRRNS
jgi:hypothetical protein